MNGKCYTFSRERYSDIKLLLIKCQLFRSFNSANKTLYAVKLFTRSEQALECQLSKSRYFSINYHAIFLRNHMITRNYSDFAIETIAINVLTVYLKNKSVSLTLSALTE